MKGQNTIKENQQKQSHSNSIYGITGHRPKRLCLLYTQEDKRQLKMLAEK